MAIVPNTEIRDPELGPIRFEDGKSITGISGAKNIAPRWICRPDGWDSDSEFEIYLPGDARSPQSIDRAVVALRRREQIEAEGRRLSAPGVYLSWIDLTIDPPVVAFPDDDHVYTIWKGWLDDKLQIRDFKEGTW
jgi:hypothetical protein